MYVAYVIFGSLYFVTKAVFFTFGFVCLLGVVLGLAASVLTMCAGILSFRERRRTSGRIAHRTALILPLLILALTPAIMTFRLGGEIFQPEKMAVFFIFEFLAIAQVVLAVRMKRKSIE